MKSSDWDRLAKKYHDEVISPFQKGTINPLFSEIERMGDGKKVVADVGCGLGDLLGMLAEKFGIVYAIDFSPVMIEKAKKKTKARNVKFKVMDIRDVGKFDGLFDVVITSNSVLFPEAKSVKSSLSAMRSSLKENGTLLGIFPSMESVLYQGFLIMDRQLDRIGDEKKASRSAKIIFENAKYDFISSTFKDGKYVQKFFYEFELKARLKDAGFRNIRFSKVLYPWRSDISDHEVFEGKPKMWDWFVVARK